MRRAILLIAALGFLFSIAGCAVPVGLAASAGLSAAQAGSSAWVNGELRESVLVDLDKVFSATKLALDDLEVEIFTDRLGERSAYIMAKERGGPEIKVTMTRRTPRLTRIGVRVGFIGELPSSRIVLDRIHAHLPQQSTLQAVQPAREVSE